MQQNDNQQIVFQGQNSAVDKGIAGVVSFMVSGPLGVVASHYFLKFIAKHAGAQQKWVVWLLAGVLVGPPLGMFQLYAVESLISPSPGVVEQRQ